jgi:hypothetical protein
MLARLVVGILLLGIAFATQAMAKVSEAELAQISLNAISLCVHAALYQHDGLDAAALYQAVLTVEHPAGATPVERDCLWAQLHREGTLDRSGPNGRETRFNQALLLQVVAAYLTIPPPIPPQYLQFRVQPLDSYPAADRAAAGTLQTAGITLTWQARWADPANPDAASPPTLKTWGKTIDNRIELKC